MASISTTGTNTWLATFNRSEWRIAREAKDMAIWRIVGGQSIRIDNPTGETRSLLRFWKWHVDSKRAESELPTLYAVADGRQAE